MGSAALVGDGREGNLLPWSQTAGAWHSPPDELLEGLLIPRLFSYMIGDASFSFPVKSCMMCIHLRKVSLSIRNWRKGRKTYELGRDLLVTWNLAVRTWSGSAWTTGGPPRCYLAAIRPLGTY